MTYERGVFRNALGIAGLCVASILLLALLVRALAAPEARELLGFGFAGLERRAGVVAEVFLSNARVMAAAFLATLLVGLLRSAQGRDPEAAYRLAFKVARAGCDLALGALFVLNVALVGAALGGYGKQMAMALLPHGPVELVAFCLSLGIYMAARQGDSPPIRAARVAATALGLLLVAAVLEVLAD